MTLRITSNLRVFPSSSQSSNYVWKHPWSQPKAFIAFLKIPLSLQKQWGKSGSRDEKSKGTELEGAGPRVEQLREGGSGRVLPNLPPLPVPCEAPPTSPAFDLGTNSWIHQACLSPGLAPELEPPASVPFPNVEPQNQDFSSPCDVPPRNPGQTVGKQAAADPVLPTNSTLRLFTPDISKNVPESRGDAGWIWTMSPGHLTVLLSL